MLNWATRDANSDYQYLLPSMTLYHSEDPLIPQDQWLHEFINVNLHESFNEFGPNPKTECLYTLGFERNYGCSEHNCAIHCDWGICFHEVRNELSPIFSDIESFSERKAVVTNWLDGFMSRRFPNISFGYSSLIYNTPFTIHP